MTNSSIEIGGLKLDSPFILAPLAGVTDSPFRRICQNQGAALTYTEMVSAKGLYYNSKNTEALLSISSEEGPVGIQLFGAEPQMLAYAAEQLSDRSHALIDINMGCPVPKVVKNGEGSALLKTPELAAECLRAVIAKAKKPVTVKMRVGFSQEYFDYTAFAFAMQTAGASALAVHGRTREQFYTGHADYGKIKEIKGAIHIPVIGNGDVFSAEDALRLMDETNCDAVMIARGALGNPWIFRECTSLWNGHRIPSRPETDEIINMIIMHLTLAVAQKGEYAAVREMRKHVSWYAKGIKNAARLRQRVNEATTEEEMADIIHELGR
ncbi:MAG: tRNA dihydrouridine synthase DusB [Clostridia bacterium]|nr:tRNA dihydrouridine synthase DusB [Clostridia bacterium]